jgi:hypothetical protein
MIADIMQIAEDLDASLPTIQESLFKRDFLPFFLQQIPESDVPLAVSAWMNAVAGSSSTPVRVVAPDQTVLFTVPALLDLTKVVVTDPNHFEHAVAAHTLLSVNQPEIADALMREEMQSAMENSIEISDTDNWLPMLKYYGITPPTTTDKSPVHETSVLDDLGL